MRELLDRRSFFGVAARGVAAGIIGAELSRPVRQFVVETVEDLGISTTGTVRPDQVQFGQKQPQSCPDPNNDFFQQCKKPINTSIDKGVDILWQLAREEMPARVIPSYIVSKRDGRPNPLLDTLAGTGEMGMSRREITFLIFGSLLFGFVHNVGPKGEFDTKKIPVYQTVGGMFEWVAQRKFGAVAPFAFHFWSNFRQGAYR